MLNTPQTMYWDEVMDFLASTPTPSQIVAYQPSEALQQRMSYLMAQNREMQLTLEERQELSDLLYLNRFMSRLKLHARSKITA